MANTAFCQRCYDKHMASIQKMDPKNKNVFVDKYSISYRCKIPIYSHDATGRAIVTIRDCRVGDDVVYTDEEYKRLQRMGYM